MAALAIMHTSRTGRVTQQRRKWLIGVFAVLYFAVQQVVRAAETEKEVVKNFRPLGIGLFCNACLRVGISRVLVLSHTFRFSFIVPVVFLIESACDLH